MSAGVKSLLVLEVDLVLALGALVVGGLDLKVHSLQRHTDLPPGGFAVIQRAQIEVASLIVGLGGGLSLVIGLEQEKLCFRPHVESLKAHISGLLDGPLQNIAGIPGKRRPVGVVHVTDQPGHLFVQRPPGKDAEGLQIRIKILVGLIDTDKALDGGAVKHTLIVYRLLNLGGGNGHVFQLAENIRKLEANKFDILLPDHTDDILFTMHHKRAISFLSVYIPHIAREALRRKALRPPGRNALVHNCRC